MEPITLRQALSVLSKSAPYSVSTIRDKNNGIYSELKNSLYVEQQIELDFKQKLESANPGEVIFLCGSSGDGKSEILTRYYDAAQSRYRFHLDATHSFSPHQSAIQALDELFNGLTETSKTMVVGINIGMLANFAKEGAERHQLVKEAIEQFLNGEFVLDRRFSFLDFENYPKFYFNEHDQVASEFATSLMQKLTRQDESNLFYCIAQRAEQNSEDLQLIANFRLLAMPAVQQVLITNLFKLRLAKDQFITTRAFLNLLYHLLAGGDYLWNNLFSGSDDELLQRIAELDPALIRSQELDQLVLRYELGLADEALVSFIDGARQYGIELPTTEVKLGDANSLVRLLYMMKEADFSTNYQQQFSSEFEDKAMAQYARIWRDHKDYSLENSEPLTALRKFYAQELVSAVYRYANRKAPELGKRELLVGQFGNTRITAPVEIKGNFSKIAVQTEDKYQYFHAHFKVMDKPIKPIQISLALLELIQRINQGYRPNRYDKSVVVMLDEIVDQISDLAKQSSTLNFYEGSRKFEVSDDDGMITVEGGYN